MKTWIAFVAVVAQLICLAGGAWAQPFTRIVSPVQDQCVPGPDVKVQFQAGGMTLGPSAWNLHFKLDDQPFQVQYDGNHAHVFKNVRPGTHTIRVYAANAMQEAIPGTQSTVSFSVAYPDKANYVMPGQPTLTYNLPQGEYVGIDAADVTVDFLLENVTLSPGGYQVAYYADGRRFLVQDGCGPRHLKNLAPGFHRIRMELQDRNGDLVPGPFNSEERVILVSPDSIVKSPSPLHDGYHGLPRLDSIKGSMTMGQHWSATEQVHPLTEDDVLKQESLTVVRRDGETVGLVDGEVLTGGPAEVDQAVTVDEPPLDAVVREGFTVRQGGEVETDAVDLDVIDTDTVRSGTVIVNEDEPGDDGMEVMDADAPDTVIVEDEDEAAVVVEEAEATTTTARTTRRRADGTTTTVRATTETLKLADRPGLRTVETQTTRTVRASDEATSPSRAGTDDDSTTRGERRRRDREDRQPPAPELD